MLSYSCSAISREFTLNESFYESSRSFVMGILLWTFQFHLQHCVQFQCNKDEYNRKCKFQWMWNALNYNVSLLSTIVRMLANRWHFTHAYTTHTHTIKKCSKNDLKVLLDFRKAHTRTILPQLWWAFWFSTGESTK